VVDSDTQVTARWDSTGLPAITAKPSLVFVSSSISNLAHFAENNAANLTKNLVIIPPTNLQPLSCSY